MTYVGFGLTPSPPSTYLQPIFRLFLPIAGQTRRQGRAAPARCLRAERQRNLPGARGFRGEASGG